MGHNRSVSAKAAQAAKRAEKLQRELAKATVKLPDGILSHVTPGTTVSGIESFAGKGAIKGTELRVRDFLVQNYGGKAENWQHSKGRGWVDVPEGTRKAVLHWFYEESVGVRELFVKG